MLTSALSSCASDTQQTLTLAMGAPASVAPPPVPSRARSHVTRAVVPVTVTQIIEPVPTVIAEAAVEPEMHVDDDTAAIPVESFDAITAWPANELASAIEQLCRVSASASERSACLRVIAHLLQDYKPAVSPIAPRGSTAEDNYTLIASLMFKLCECLQTTSTPLRYVQLLRLHVSRCVCNHWGIASGGTIGC